MGHARPSAVRREVCHGDRDASLPRTRPRLARTRAGETPRRRLRASTEGARGPLGRAPLRARRRARASRARDHASIHGSGARSLAGGICPGADPWAVEQSAKHRKMMVAAPSPTGGRHALGRRHPMIRDADIVVIGSGGFSAAIVYFLMRRGGRRMALLGPARSRLPDLAARAGNAAVLRSTDLMSRPAGRAVDRLLRFTDDTGEPLEIVRSGSLKAARTAEAAATLAREAVRGEGLGLGTRILSP